MRRVVRKRWLSALLIALVALTQTSCIIALQSGSVDLVNREAISQGRLRMPTKVFLEDGSIVVYPEGARVRADSIVGTGVQHALGLGASRQIVSLPLDRAVGIETFQGGANTLVGLASIGASALVAYWAFLALVFSQVEFDFSGT